MKLHFLFIFALFSLKNIYAQDCPPDNAYLYPSDIDSFLINYPNCTKINGNIKIKYPRDLSTLKNITEITGDLEISRSSSLNNLKGLHNLQKIGGEFLIWNMSGIKNLEGLNSLIAADPLHILGNDSLINLEGLESISQFEGGLKITSNELLEDLSVLSNIEEIAGQLIIENNDNLTKLKGLNNIERVSGRVEIEKNQKLSSLQALRKLKWVGGIFYIWENPILENLDGLEALEIIKGFLSIRQNENLNSIEGLKNLREVSNLGIYSCPKLVSTNGLESIEKIGTLSLVANATLTTVNKMDRIEEIGGINLTGNPVLNKIIGFKNLSSFSNDLKIKNCPLINDLDPFSNLENIDGGLYIEENPQSFSLSHLTKLKSLGKIYLNNNTNLPNLNGLEKIQKINEWIIVKNNSGLESIEALRNLKSIEEDLLISNNSALKNLDGLGSLEKIGGKLSIDRNPIIKNLDSLSKVSFIQLDELNIISNPFLSICNNPFICNFLHLGTSIIENNADGCNTKEEIIKICNSPTGKLAFNYFFDINIDGDFQFNEPFYSDFNIEIQDIGLELSGNPKSLGSIELPYGKYSFIPHVNPNWYLTNNLDTNVIDLNSSMVEDTLLIGIYPKNIISKMESWIYSTPTKCLDTASVYINAKNQGTSFTNGIIWLQIDSNLIDIKFNEIPDSTNGFNLFGWKFEDLIPGHSAVKSIQVVVPDRNISKGRIKLTSFIEFDDHFGLYITDTSEYESNVNCLENFDGKIVNPPKIDDRYSLRKNHLIYTIRFQNNGNNHVENVIIKDTLDFNFDLSTFKVLGSSHYGALSTFVENDRFISFNFKNIYLPDSNTNFDKSQGFVSYLIKAKEGLSEMTPIRNTASIYFNQNPPIVTNTTENIMVSECLVLK